MKQKKSFEPAPVRKAEAEDSAAGTRTSAVDVVQCRRTKWGDAEPCSATNHER